MATTVETLGIKSVIINNLHFLILPKATGGHIFKACILA